MLTNRKNKESKNLLDLVPERKMGYREGEGETIEVMIPRYGHSRIGKILSSLLKEKPIVVKLDSVGSFIWELSDGRRNVEAIGGELVKRYGEGIEPVYDRLSIFFKQMEIRGLIEWKKDMR